MNKRFRPNSRYKLKQEELDEIKRFKRLQADVNVICEARIPGTGKSRRNLKYAIEENRKGKIVAFTMPTTTMLDGEEESNRLEGAERQINDIDPNFKNYTILKSIIHFTDDEDIIRDYKDGVSPVLLTERLLENQRKKYRNQWNIKDELILCTWDMLSTGILGVPDLVIMDEMTPVETFRVYQFTNSEYNEAVSLCCDLEEKILPDIPPEATCKKKEYLLSFLSKYKRDPTVKDKIYELDILLTRIQEWKKWEYLFPYALEDKDGNKFVDVPYCYIGFDLAVRGTEVRFLSAYLFKELYLQRQLNFYRYSWRSYETWEKYRGSNVKVGIIPDVVLPSEEDNSLTSNKESKVIRVIHRQKGSSRKSRFSKQAVSDALKNPNSLLLKEIDKITWAHRGQKIGLISKKDFKKKFGKIFDIQHILHYYNLRSKNILEDCEGLIVIWTPTMNPKGFEEYLKSFMLLPDHKFEEILSKNRGWNIDQDGRIKFKNKIAQSLHLALNEHQMYQAIHRSRLIRNKRIVYVFGIIPEKIKEEATVIETDDLHTYLDKIQQQRETEFDQRDIKWEKIFKEYGKDKIKHKEITQLLWESYPIPRRKVREVVKNAVKSKKLIKSKLQTKGRGRKPVVYSTKK